MDLPALYIVTGTSRGFGEALAALLLEQPGAQVLALSRQASAPLQARAVAHGAVLEQWPVDLRDGAAVARRLAQWLAGQPAQWREVCLVNNAALLPAKIAPLSESAADDIDDVLRVNLHTPLQLTAQFLRSTGAWQVPRKVLNISSGLARAPMASMALYSAAKAGVDQFTLCLALEEARKPGGARVCALAPGVVDTGMQQQMRDTAEAQFPDAARFRFLHASKRLMPAAQAARKALDLLESPDFGERSLAELRQGGVSAPPKAS